MLTNHLLENTDFNVIGVSTVKRSISTELLEYERNSRF